MSQSRIPVPTAPFSRAERTRFVETSRYADVVAFLDSLRGRPELTFGSIGRTVEQREIPYVIAARPRVVDPADVGQRPVVYVQANIHAGEVEGKEAVLALLRDLTASRRPNVLDSLVLIAVPIYNADGNERFGPQATNRAFQNGPEVVGRRVNAAGLDLNRDYIKVEAPETRASLAMFNKWHPDVFVDLHTTNGSYHGYALTYAGPLHPSAPLGAYTRDSILPVLRQRMQQRYGFATFDYGDFISADTLEKGWATFDSRPRFGTNYYGLRGGISILSEAYSHDPFERRIRATYAFTREILSLVAERGPRLVRLADLPRNRQGGFRNAGDRPISPPNAASATSGAAAPPASVALRSRMVAAPRPAPVIAELIERTGDSTRTEPGMPRGLRRTGRYRTVLMPVYDRFVPVLERQLPLAYAFSRLAGDPLVEVLARHGIEAERWSPAGPGNMEFFTIDSIIVAPRPFQGHREVRLEGEWKRTTGSIPSGWRVQPPAWARLLAAYLLEPESDDGLTTWNYFDGALRMRGQFPILRIPAPQQ